MTLVWDTLVASDSLRYHYRFRFTVLCPSLCAGYAMEKKSTIIAIGLTVHSTPVEIRERLAVPEAEWPRAIAELTSFPHIEEAAVLSTCNRMELYIVALSQRRGTREVRSLTRVLCLPVHAFVS